MNQFETPDWAEGNTEEKWTSGLFEQSYAKVKKTKIRKRNKYPKGFAKSDIPIETKKVKSSSTLKFPKSEIPDESSNDQNVTQNSKKKRKKGNVGGFGATENDASEPPLKALKTGDKASARNSLAHSDKEKKLMKRKISGEPWSVQNNNHQKAVKTINHQTVVKSKSSKSSKSEDTCIIRDAVRRKKKKNKGSSDSNNDANEQPVGVKKLSENSTVKDDSCVSSPNETLSQETPKKRKRNRKKKKNTSLENAEDKKPVSECSAQESTPLLSSSKRRRERRKRRESKAQENQNLKGKKKRKRPKTGQEREVEETMKMENLQKLHEDGTEGAKEINDATNEKNIEASESDRKRRRKSIEKSVTSSEQNGQSNDFSSKLNISLKMPIKSESLSESKCKKKKHEVKEKNMSDCQTSLSTLTDMTSVNDEKEDLNSLESNFNEGHIGANCKAMKKKGLREKMEEKLRGARFRFLNEQLYNSKSGDTRKYFLIEPDAFKAYHEGYKQQLNEWPMKPIDLIIKSLKKKPTNLVVADFGCGDAQLSKALPNKVHSFDHVALNEHVTACDMANTPLSKRSVDVVVFCLSLMGSNLSDYIAEANRVLKMGGLMKIAEVESRFDDVSKFVKSMGKFGFLCTRQDLSNDYFYLFDFRKEKNIKEGKMLPALELRACSYKKR